MTHTERSQQKPSIEFQKPKQPGRGLMWAGAAVVIFFIGVAMLPDSQDSGSPSMYQSVDEPTALLEPSPTHGELLQDTFAAIAAADRAVAEEAKNGAENAPDALEASLRVKGVTIGFADLTAWTQARQDNMVMLANSSTNVLCQVTARADAVPGDLQTEVNGNEVGYEIDYMGMVLPGGSGDGELVFRNTETGAYRYAVRGTFKFQMGGQTSTMKFLNAVAIEGAKMARLQCANRTPGAPSSLEPAIALARSMRIRAG